MAGVKSVALLSGGLDSTVATTAAHRGGEVVLALTADYGQRARRQELRAARAVSRALGVEHRVVELPFIKDVARTPLVGDQGELPHLTRSELDQGGEATERSAAAVWVPNRNGVLLQVAAMFAESLGADQVVVGFNAEEAVTFADNSEPFLAATTRALEFSTQNHVRAVSATGFLDKAGIVRLGYEIDAPLPLIWSCYEAGREHCWRCESCLRLRRALEQAGAIERFLRERKASEPPSARDL
jgi:7-cyano-7-deazaguanine synthase